MNSQLNDFRKEKGSIIVLNHNSKDYMRAKRRKQVQIENNNRVSQLEQEVQELKNMLSKLISEKPMVEKPMVKNSMVENERSK